MRKEFLLVIVVLVLFVSFAGAGERWTGKTQAVAERANLAQDSTSYALAPTTGTIANVTATQNRICDGRSYVINLSTPGAFITSVDYGTTNYPNDEIRANGIYIEGATTPDGAGTSIVSPANRANVYELPTNEAFYVISADDGGATFISDLRVVDISR